MSTQKRLKVFTKSIYKRHKKKDTKTNNAWQTTTRKTTD